MQRPRGGEEGLLQDVLCVLGVPAHPSAKPKDLRLILPEEGVERFPVATLCRFHEGDLFERSHRSIMPFDPAARSIIEA